MNVIELRDSLNRLIELGHADTPVIMIESQWSSGDTSQEEIGAPLIDDKWREGGKVIVLNTYSAAPNF